MLHMVLVDDDDDDGWRQKWRGWDCWYPGSDNVENPYTVPPPPPPPSPESTRSTTRKIGRESCAWEFLMVVLCSRWEYDNPNKLQASERVSEKWMWLWVSCKCVCVRVCACVCVCDMYPYPLQSYVTVASHRYHMYYEVNGPWSLAWRKTRRRWHVTVGCCSWTRLDFRMLLQWPVATTVEWSDRSLTAEDQWVYVYGTHFVKRIKSSEKEK